MSRIVVPSKPSWKITISLDESAQAQIVIEDVRQKAALASPFLGPVSRQMNPLQFATILMDIASSALKQMQLVPQKGSSDAEKKTTQ
jgi:hypothetical protein